MMITNPLNSRDSSSTDKSAIICGGSIDALSSILDTHCFWTPPTTNLTMTLFRPMLPLEHTSHSCNLLPWAYRTTVHWQQEVGWKVLDSPLRHGVGSIDESLEKRRVMHVEVSYVIIWCVCLDGWTLDEESCGEKSWRCARQSPTNPRRPQWRHLSPKWLP